MHAIRAVLPAIATGLAISTAALAAQPMISPGEWEVNATVTEARLPGAPAAMTEAMKKPHVSRHCLTPEQAARGPQDLFSHGGSGCKLVHYSAKNGKMDGAMQCTSPTMGKMTVKTSGEYAASHYHAVSNMVVDGPRGAGRMVTEVTGRRIGKCK